ncbi:MAG: RDD family protein [Bdellovibrio sp.]|nr:RDD family protein [Bdellovibrio sp.]
MLFPDLSAPQITTNKDNRATIPVAFVADRFIALILDFLIFSPIVSLLMAGLIRQAKTFFLINTHSEEGLVAAALIFLVGTITVVLLQSVFMYYWQATPGQFFLQMRVISYPNYRERLSISQCMVRSFAWCGSFLLLGLPFLEVLSHPLRRTFHERASDTMVITLKKVPDDGPEPLEQRFIASWLRMSFLFFALFVFVGVAKTYHSLSVGEYRESGTATVAMCKEIKDSELQGASRLDAALSLFLLNEITPECLHKEAELSLWGDPVNSQSMAYFAKYLLTEDEEHQKYLAKVCEDATSSACALAQYLEDSDSKRLAQADASLWVTQVLRVEEKYSRRDVAGSLELIEKLQHVNVLRSAMDKKYVRSIWALNERSQKKGGRQPASADSKPWLEDFKEKYGVQ